MTDHAKNVRAALGATTDLEWPEDPEYFTKALAALDALVAERDEAARALQSAFLYDKWKAAEAERDSWKAEADRLMGLRLAAEAERDSQKVTLNDIAGKLWDETVRAEAAKAEVARLTGFVERYDYWMLATAKALGWEHEDWNGQDPAVTVGLAKAAEAQSRVLREALEFYADGSHYLPTLKDAASGRDLPIIDDGGHRAIAALGKDNE